MPEVTPHLTAGIRALLAGDARSAVARLLQGLDERPFDPVLHFDLAVAYRLRGDLPRALGHARLACELEETAHSHALYGLHCWLARHRDLAEQHLEAALAKQGDYRLAALYLGLLRQEQGRRDEAYALLERAIAAGPDPLPALVAQRVRGQLFDLAREATSRESTVGEGETLWCTVGIVTEILLPDGIIVLDAPHIRPPRQLVSPSPHRVCTADEVAGAIHSAERIVALTGAGISSGSGLATRKQLWQRYDRDASVSIFGVAQEPRALWQVIRAFLGGDDPLPNPAHQVLASLGSLRAIVTQNVDGLHQRAQLRADVPVIELHGTLARVICSVCGAHEPGDARAHASPCDVPVCRACGGPLRPDVVLFGEQVRREVLEEAVEAVECCDLLLVIGCSMDVAPASELPALAAARGVRVIELKRAASRISDAIGSWLLPGPAEETLPEVYTALARLEPLPPLLPNAISSYAPAPLEPVVLPSLGESYTEVYLAQWRRAPGEWIEAGAVLAECDTDKICVEITAPVSGVIASLHAAQGDTIPIGSLLAEIVPEAPRGPQPAVHEAHHPLFLQLGPHARTVRKAISSLDEANWLLAQGPRPALEEQMRAYVEAHARAVGVPLSVWFSEDPHEVCARWSAWEDPATGGALPQDAVTLAWGAAVAAARPQARLPAPLVAWLHPRLRRRVAVLHESTPWGAAGALGSIGVLIGSWLPRIASSGQDSDPPCPFAPLLAIFRAGGWPFALPGGVVGIYLARSGATGPAATRRRRELAQCGLVGLVLCPS